MQILTFLSIAVASYYLLSILQAVFHRSHGHSRRIRAVFQAHAIGHHRQYPAKRLQSETFVALESHALYYYLIPVALLAASIFAAFGPMAGLAHITGAIVTFAWHIYLHRQYHLLITPLERFAWFRAKRELHFIHHRNARVNFAVVEFWVDRLMGTRSRP